MEEKVLKVRSEWKNGGGKEEGVERGGGEGMGGWCNVRYRREVMQTFYFFMLRSSIHIGIHEQSGLNASLPPNL